jgi:hypothetical protein
LSGEEGAPGPEPAPARPSGPPGAGSPSTGNVVGGVFLIGCGLCLALLGGSCTALYLLVMANTSTGSSQMGELFTPVAMFMVGIVALVFGVRLVTRRSGG